MNQTQANPIDQNNTGNTASAGPGYKCQTNSWYMEQYVIEPGNGFMVGNNPVDQPYTYTFMTDCSRATRPIGEIELIPMMMGVQQGRQANIGAGLAWWMGGSFVLQFSNAYSELFMTSGQITTLRTQYATTLKSLIDGYSTGQWQSEAGLFYMTCTSTTTPAQYAYSSSSRQVCDGIALALPLFDYYGVSDSIVDAIQTWAEAVWPAVNWATQRAATCTPTGTPAYPKCSNVP